MNQAAAGAAGTRQETTTGLPGGLLQVSIDVPFNHDDFADAFARQSANLVIQGSNQAEIQLNPRDMGPIRIAISLDANAASLDIEAAHADTRAAIEASMPALRQMLADQGVRLADYRVDNQSTGDRQQQSAGDPGRHDPGRHAHHADGSQTGAQPGSQQAGGHDRGDASAQALADGFGGGRSSHAADRRDTADRQDARVLPGAPASRTGAAGRPGGSGNSRLDLYA
jgi:flagellar hook-length control protein FliK